MHRRAVLRAGGFGLWSALAWSPPGWAQTPPGLPSQTKWFGILTLLRGFRDPFTFAIHVGSFKDDALLAENQVDVYFRSHKQVLILFRAPQSVAGRRILIQGADMWLAMPSTKRVLRILPSQRLLGEASNGDLINTDFAEYSLVEERPQTEGQERLIYLKIVATTEAQTYQSIEYLMDPATSRPRFSRHYAASGKLLKSITYLDFKPVDGNLKMSALKLVNPLIPNQHTMMSFSNFRPMPLAEGLFEKNSLPDLVL
jgi:hypothetical protein